MFYFFKNILFAAYGLCLPPNNLFGSWTAYWCFYNKFFKFFSSIDAAMNINAL